jgi:hypothetical protein
MRSGGYFKAAESLYAAHTPVTRWITHIELPYYYGNRIFINLQETPVSYTQKCCNLRVFVTVVHFNSVLSSIGRSPIHHSIKIFSNPYLYTFVFPSLCSIVSVPYYLWLNIPTLVKFLVTFRSVYLFLQKLRKFHTQKCFPLALYPENTIKFCASFWETDQFPHPYSKQHVRSSVEISSLFWFYV